MTHSDAVLSNDIIDIPALQASGKRYFQIDARFEFHELPGALEESHPLAEVTGELTFHQTGFDISGEFSADAEQACHRCGQGFSRHIHDTVDESIIFVQHANQKLTGEVELTANDFYETLGDGEDFDLKQLIQDLLIIAMSYDAYCPTCRQVT